MPENMSKDIKTEAGTIIDESIPARADSEPTDNDDVDCADVEPTLADYDEWEKSIEPEPKLYDCAYGGKTRILEWATPEEQGRSLARSLTKTAIAIGRYRLEQAEKERRNGVGNKTCGI